jgi:hypothetical protein
VLAIGCGSNGAADEDPEQLLRDAFSDSRMPRSGVLDGSLELSITTPGSQDSQTIVARGPFEVRGDDRAPEFDLAVDYPLADEDLRLIATADGGFVTLDGASYRVNPSVVRRFELGAALSAISPEGWFSDPSNQGAEEVAGTETIRIAAGVNEAALLSDLRAASERIGLWHGTELAPAASFEEATIEAFVEVEGRVLRRLEVHLAWDGELECEEPFDATLDLAVEIGEVNEEQEIEPPERVRSPSELPGRLPPELFGLGEFLSGGQGAPRPVTPPDRGELAEMERIAALVNGFFDAWNEGDGDLACSYLTERGQRLVLRIVREAEELQGAADAESCTDAIEASAELTEERIGQSATVDRVRIDSPKRAAVISRFRGELSLRKVEGEWLIDTPSFFD